MNCQTCHEAISARMDGEQPAVGESLVAAHIADCEGCRRWKLAAHEVTRRIRVAEAPAARDRTEDLLATVLATREQQWPRRHRTIARLVLLAAGLAQFALCVPALGFGHLHGDATHAAHELGAFDVVLAVGFLVAVVVPSRARGMVAMVGAGALALVGTGVLDLASGRTDALDEAPHLVALFGWLALWVLARSRGTNDDPSVRAGKVGALLVRSSTRFGRRKRESGANPELPRSGKWERTPSSALGSGLGSDSK